MTNAVSVVVDSACKLGSQSRVVCALSLLDFLVLGGIGPKGYVQLRSRFGILVTAKPWCKMPETSTLSYVADLVIRRALAESACDPGTDLAQAIERAYPFDYSRESRRIWLNALLRHALVIDAAAKTASTLG